MLIVASFIAKLLMGEFDSHFSVLQEATTSLLLIMKIYNPNNGIIILIFLFIKLCYIFLTDTYRFGTIQISTEMSRTACTEKHKLHRMI